MDNDPVVLNHARALLTSSREGETDYILADLRDTATILSGAARMIYFSKPVAVLLRLTGQVAPGRIGAAECPAGGSWSQPES